MRQNQIVELRFGYAEGIKKAISIMDKAYESDKEDFECYCADNDICFYHFVRKKLKRLSK